MSVTTHTPFRTNSWFEPSDAAGRAGRETAHCTNIDCIPTMRPPRARYGASDMSKAAVLLDRMELGERERGERYSVQPPECRLPRARTETCGLAQGRGGTREASKPGRAILGDGGTRGREFGVYSSGGWGLHIKRGIKASIRLVHFEPFSERFGGLHMFKRKATWWGPHRGRTWPRSMS